jgi:hypothetical protein
MNTRLTLFAMALPALLGCAVEGPSFDGCLFPDEEGLLVIEEFYEAYVSEWGEDADVLHALQRVHVECRSPDNDEGEVVYEWYGKEESSLAVTLAPDHILMANNGTWDDVAARTPLAHELMHVALWAAKGDVRDSVHPWEDRIDAFVFKLYGH